MAIRTGNAVARRALVGAALVVAGGAAGATVAPIVEHATQQDAINKAYMDGFAAGRQAIISQLKQVNGIGLESAITTAHTTRAATKVIAKPAANMFASIAGDALSTIINVIGAVRNVTFFISGAYDLLGKLKDYFSGLQATIGDLGVPVEELGAADIEGASVYLDGVVAALPELLA